MMMEIWKFSSSKASVVTSAVSFSIDHIHLFSLVAPGYSVNIFTYVSYSRSTHSPNTDLKSVLCQHELLFLCVPALTGYYCDCKIIETVRI